MKRRLPIFYNALLLTGVNLLLRFVSTSFQVHISGRIGAAGVGLLQLVLSVGALSLTAGMAGIRTATMYLTAEELGKKRPGNVVWVLSGCFVYSLIVSCLVAFTLYHFSPILAEKWIGDIRTVDALRLYAMFIPLICLCSCMTGYFTAANRIGTLAAVEVAEQLCYMAITMALLQFWAGTDPSKACESIILGSGLSSIFTLITLVILRHREHGPIDKPIPIRSRLLNTAVPLALADDLRSGISTTENLMVPKRLALYPGELTPLATFGMVCGMVFPVMMFPAAILFALAELLIPELARCAAAESHKRIRYLVRKSLRICILYGCLCCGVLFLCAEDLCVSLYKSVDAGKHLKFYSLMVPMLYCDAITDAMTKGLGQQKACVRYNIITSSMDVLFLYLLLPRYGMHGYFISFLITHLLNFGLSLRRLLKITHMKIPFYRPAMIFASLLGGVVAGSLITPALLRAAIFIATFICLLTLLQVVSRQDILWVKGLIKKSR